MFGSWSYHGYELDLSSKINRADLSSVKENVEWIINKAPAIRHEIYYGCCPEPYPDVTFYIYLSRKPDYYVTNIIIPSIMVTLVAALGFFLPVDAGEKVGLELTVMLAMSVFQLLIADHLPPSADETPWICKYLYLFLEMNILCTEPLPPPTKTIQTNRLLGSMNNLHTIIPSHIFIYYVLKTGRRQGK